MGGQQTLDLAAEGRVAGAGAVEVRGPLGGAGDGQGGGEDRFVGHGGPPQDEACSVYHAKSTTATHQEFRVFLLDAPRQSNPVRASVTSTEVTDARNVASQIAFEVSDRRARGTMVPTGPDRFLSSEMNAQAEG